MFTRLAKAGLARTGFARFWPVEPRRDAPVSCQAGLPAHGNDNLPGFRRPALSGKRRSATPALACRWIDRDGRLECRWQAGPDGDAPIGGRDESGALGWAAGPIPGGAVIHKTVVELSCREAVPEGSAPETHRDRAIDPFDLMCCARVTRRRRVINGPFRVLPSACE
jgi:hypothetical protein